MRLAAIFLAASSLAGIGMAQAADPIPVKIGVLNGQSGLYAHLGGALGLALALPGRRDTAFKSVPDRFVVHPSHIVICAAGD